MTLPVLMEFQALKKTNNSGTSKNKWKFW